MTPGLRSMRFAGRAAAALIGWTYAVFPLAVLVRGRLVRRPYATAAIEPTVSVIVAAHDEAAAIGARLDNLLDLAYPPDRLEIVVASDGSIDGTNEIVARRGPRVRLLALPRVGKGEALGGAVAASRGEILVFSDANSRYALDAVRCLVRPFADPSVGGVAGNQLYLPPTSSEATAAGERRYWDLDRALKVAQTSAGGFVSATGAIYAIRRELFRPIPDGATDDLASSLAVAAAGQRFVFAPDAVAWEPVAASHRAEFGRKVRVMTRGLRCVVAYRELLDPSRHGLLSLELLTRKVLMRAMAIPLLVRVLADVSLAPTSRVHRFLAAGELGVLAAGVVGLATADRPLGRHRLLALPAYFCLVQAASLVALWNLVTGRRIDRWRPARATDEAAPSRAPGRTRAPAVWARPDDTSHIGVHDGNGTVRRPGEPALPAAAPTYEAAG